MAATSRQHAWVFVGGQREGKPFPVVMAVCSTCGLIRLQDAPGRKTEKHLDLTGDCPAELKPEPPLEPLVG
jgi:hypothetical protein